MGNKSTLSLRWGAPLNISSSPTGSPPSSRSHFIFNVISSEYRVYSGTKYSPCTSPFNTVFASTADGHFTSYLRPRRCCNPRTAGFTNVSRKINRMFSELETMTIFFLGSVWRASGSRNAAFCQAQRTLPLLVQINKTSVAQTRRFKFITQRCPVWELCNKWRVGMDHGTTARL